MPKPTTQFQTQPPEPFTTVPNALLDLDLPKLSGSELAVILIVIRKTLGFHKLEDTISIGQFQKATGLSRHTVIGALESSVCKGFISRRPGLRYNGQEQIYKYNQARPKPTLVKSNIADQLEGLN